MWAELAFHAIAVSYVLFGTAIAYHAMPGVVDDHPAEAETLPGLILFAAVVFVVIWPIGMFLPEDEDDEAP